MRIIRIFKEIKIVLFATVSEWLDDKMMLYAAGLAFYTIFSLAPLLIILVAVSGWIFGEQAAAGQLSEFMEDLMGRELAVAIENFVNSVHQEQSGGLAAMLGIGILLFAATTVITHLKESMNTIWNVTAKEGKGLIMLVVDRFLALLFILILASVLASLVIIDAVMNYMGPIVDDFIPGGISIWSKLNLLVSIAVTTLLFAIIYKMLPDIKVKWSDVWVGAFVTALLFTLGRYVIGLYIGSGATESAYGAAGSFVIFLVWVYYNAMMVFLGAEFTYIYTKRYGSTVETRRFVKFVTEDIPSWAIKQPRKQVGNIKKGIDNTRKILSEQPSEDEERGIVSANENGDDDEVFKVKDKVNDKKEDGNGSRKGKGNGNGNDNGSGEGSGNGDGEGHRM